MQITFWGTRGSIARPGAATARYGGNTSCVEIRSDSGTLIVVDCGTGGYALGQQLMAQKKGAVNGNIVISHTHWDHIQGIPFFAPLFVPGNTWDVYGPKGLSQSLRATLAGQMEHTYFPIALDQFAATIRYHDLVEGAFNIDDIHIVTRYLNHPALTLGYRIEVDGASVAYCCDHEPHASALGTGRLPITGIDRRYADFVSGADLVIHDAQYTASEYAESKIGWGHSPVEYAVRVCLEANVKRLLLTHHDPLRSDTDVERIVDVIRRQLGEGNSPLEVMAASEGLTVPLRGDPGRVPGRAKDHFLAKTAIDVPAYARPVLLRLVDDDTSAALADAINSEGIPYRMLADDSELLRAVTDDQPALVMIQHAPPRIDGIAIARGIREAEGDKQVRVPMVLVSTVDHAAGNHQGLATDWLVAPFSQSYARTKLRAWILRTASRWIRAALPVDESRRLASLRDLRVLDTPPEKRFDRLTRLAAAALDVPIALISLVDSERQWFKSCFGLDATETSREVAFCAHVVHQKAEMIVPDTLLDDRFADNPLVLQEPRIRFYAGAPLILGDGSCIGTMCVVDKRPREFNHAELVILRDLRDLALEELGHPHLPTPQYRA